MVLLVLDFDGTICEHDTISELAASAIRLQQARHGHDNGHDNGGRSNLQAAWDSVVQEYMADYDAYLKATSPPAEAQRSSVAQEARWLAGLKPVEEASLDRVGRSGVFAGLDAQQLFQMGVEAVETGRVTLRAGFGELVELAGRRGWQTAVVSVHWSRQFVRGILPRGITVVANDVSSDGHIGGPEFLGFSMTTSPDKLKALRHLVAGRRGPVLYFGDSPTDMECLLYARGIAMADSNGSRLMQTLRRVGLQVPHVGKQKESEANVCWARDFREVLESGILERHAASDTKA